MTEETYIRLQYSESVVSHMASRILSAFIASGQLSETNEDELMNRSLAMAIDLALKADRLIDSDEESKT
jgi:hypothetical protein